MEKFFASCPRGLEALLAEDIAQLGVRDFKAIPGGVHFCASWPQCYALNLNSRIASRVLWRVAHASYAKEEDIYRLALNTAWRDWFSAEQTIRVDVTAVHSPLKSLEFITLRIKDAICDCFRQAQGKRPSVDTREPDMRIQAFITANECTLYLDTSGAPLYQRGLRQKTVEAPLKENLAAGILRLIGWQPGQVLFDPMCGSGTFLLEAAQIAQGRAPGSGRDFAFTRLHNLDAAAWTSLLNEAQARESLPSATHQISIFGSDYSPVALRAALANLDRAGLLPWVKLSVADILSSDAPAADSGIMVSNPPYGERLSEQDELAEFYPLLASTLKTRFAGWHCHFLSADTRLPKLMRLKPSKRTPLFNGALECRLYGFAMVAGSNRDRAG
ncbi:MAG: THUMP domain-containing protein [Pseudomonadota bacterium]